MILRLATHAMATRFELVLAGTNEARLRAVGEAAFEEIHDAERRLSKFDRGSLLSRVNANAAAGPVRVDHDTFELLELCREVHAASQGAFDPTIAPLMHQLGFHAGSQEGSVGLQHVELDAENCAVRFTRPVALDLGGIGKGHALDLAADVLREHHIEHALLHGGTSTVVALGAPPDGSSWTVRVEDRTVELMDRALSVSAQHGREIRPAGASSDSRIGHVIDPRTHAPVARARSSAVLAKSAALADAWSTALLVLGPDFIPPPHITPVSLFESVA